MRQSYIPSLDAWRAIAISLVIFAHGFPSVAGREVPQIAAIGTLGVRLFFGLSGFLITSLLLEEESRAGSVSLKSFYIRRFFRIIPAAAAMLAATAMVAHFKIINVDSRRLIDTLLFFSNYSTSPYSYDVGHFWSLAVEEHFYLIWPVAFVITATSSRRRLTALSLCISVIIWRAIAWKFQITTEPNDVFWGRTDINADCIMFGALVALLKDDYPIFKSRAAKIGTPALLILAVTFVLFFARDWKFFQAANALIYFLIPIQIFQTTEIAPRIMEFGGLRWLGRVSYSLYLWQQLFLNPAHAGFMRQFPVNYIAALACALCSYFLIEKPFIRFYKSNFVEKPIPQVATERVAAA